MLVEDVNKFRLSITFAESVIDANTGVIDLSYTTRVLMFENQAGAQHAYDLVSTTLPSATIEYSRKSEDGEWIVEDRKKK